MGRSALWFPAGAEMDYSKAVVLDDGTPAPMFVMRGVEGIEAPPWQVALQTTPGVGGASFNSAVRGVRTIRLPVMLVADSRAQLREFKSLLISSMNPEAGPGVLMLSDALTTKDGASRCISAVYVGGLEGDEGTMNIGDGASWWEFTLEFTGLDQWYSAEPLRASWQGLPSQPFFPFSLPFTLSASGVAVDEPLDVTGDADTWPTFDLYGPFTRVRVRPAGDDVQTFWEITRSVGEFEMLRLVTKPNEESLTAWFTVGFEGDADGIIRRREFYVPTDEPNAWASLHGDSWFSPLRFRDDLIVDVEGTTSATRVELTADEAWNSAP